MMHVNQGVGARRAPALWVGSPEGSTVVLGDRWRCVESKSLDLKRALEFQDICNGAPLSH